MIGNCEMCQLPKLYRSMVAAKEAAQAAGTNASLAESPTEAEPLILKRPKVMQMSLKLLNKNMRNS